MRELKIDKAFVLKLAESHEDQTIVRSIVELGHRLSYRVTAEGVHNGESLQFLAEVGCDYAQGYFIAKAMDPEPFDQFQREARWPAREKATT
jgi:EAL domain-containing protein (putative c-di-GMP-specific phosphodiesterase class I)